MPGLPCPGLSQPSPIFLLSGPSCRPCSRRHVCVQDRRKRVGKGQWWPRLSLLSDKAKAFPEAPSRLLPTSLWPERCHMATPAAREPGKAGGQGAGSWEHLLNWAKSGVRCTKAAQQSRASQPRSPLCPLDRHLKTDPQCSLILVGSITVTGDWAVYTPSCPPGSPARRRPALHAWLPPPITGAGATARSLPCHWQPGPRRKGLMVYGS